MVTGRIVLTEPLGHESLTHISVGGEQIVARGRDPFVGGEQNETQLWLDSDRCHFFTQSGERIETGAAGGWSST